MTRRPIAMKPIPSLTAASLLAGLLGSAALGADPQPVPVLGGPASDVCQGAEAIPGCGYPDPSSLRPAFPYSSPVIPITAATLEGDPVPTCMRDARAGVWFAFTPRSSGTYTVTTCQNVATGTTVQDTALAVFDSEGTCPQTKLLACNDNDNECAGHEGQSTVKADLQAFRTYFILAYAAQESPSGSVQIQVDRERDETLPRGDFETGELGDDWVMAGDAGIQSGNPPPTCFQEDNPAWGCYMACMSNGSFFGGEALGGTRSDMISKAFTFSFKPGRIEVSFTVDFQTEEANPAYVTNDALEVRLITPAGTYPLIQIDTFGRTIPGRELAVSGYAGFTPVGEGCSLEDGRRTRRMRVTWAKSFGSSVRNLVGVGPFNLEFTILNQGSAERTSIACIDDVVVKARRPD